MRPPIVIDNVRIDPAIVLAPMEGVTDRAFRTLVRELGGAGLTVTEFVSSEGLTREVEDAWRMAELDPSERPVSIQIYGRDPERMAAAAKHCESLGADLVDINLGCPSKRVTSGCSGSALMREVDVARDIFVAVKEAIRVPMTVKMRLGWDLTSVNAPEVAGLAESCGAQMITVHGRSRCCFYKGSARWDLVRHVKEAVRVPLLVNGDITCPATAAQALETSGADGIMVGRGVMTDPWTLQRIASSWEGRAFAPPSLDALRRLLHRYLDKMDAGFGGPMNLRTMAKLRKVMGYFSKGMYGAATLRAATQDVATVEQARELIDRFFAVQAERADAPRSA